MKARYVRVSTISQKIERQLERQHPDERLYIDRISGSLPFAERPAASSMLENLEKDSTSYISVASIDRLGRNTLDVLQTIEILHSKNVCVKVDNLGLESWANGKENPTFKLIISVLANISEMERDTMLERQKQGISIAKLNGVYKGRIKGSVESDTQFLAKYEGVSSYLKRNFPPTLAEIAKLCDCSKNTVQKVKKILRRMSKDSAI